MKERLVPGCVYIHIGTSMQRSFLSHVDGIYTIYTCTSRLRLQQQTIIMRRRERRKEFRATSTSRASAICAHEKVFIYKPGICVCFMNELVHIYLYVWLCVYYANTWCARIMRRVFFFFFLPVIIKTARLRCTAGSI